MKLWQKIYSIFFICFIITFNIAGIAIIEKIHNESLNGEVKNTLKDYRSMLLVLDANFFKNFAMKRDRDVIGAVRKSSEQYVACFSQEKIHVEILDVNNDVIFTNFNALNPSEREELRNLAMEKRSYIIREFENEAYLFVSGLTNIENQNFKMSYIKNISSIYEERKRRYDFFFKFEINICIIFAAFMYIISKLITSPINKLTKSTQNIAKGNYHERVQISSKDELGILSNDFNAMADAIEEKINELQRYNDEKQRFIDNLTHELKTPLTSIIGYANLLRTTKISEKMFYDAVDFIYEEGKRLEQLSFKMMNLVLVKADDFQLKSESIMEILAETKMSLLPKVMEKNIDLIIEGEECVLYVEKDLIRMLIANLLDNAIKASEKGSKVYLRVYKNKEKTIVEVKDCGIGMDKEHLDKIMEPFYMVDKSRSRKENGAGLGLSICKKITDIHDAHITVESELNKGTSVKVLFS